MSAFILLHGKDFSLPDGVSTAIIGLFFGLVCGLFFYQRYNRSYYWAVSLTAGLAMTEACHLFFMRKINADDTSSLGLTLASFVIPFFLTLIVNFLMSTVKSRKRRRHARQKTYSRFFDSVDPSQLLRTDHKKIP